MELFYGTRGNLQAIREFNGGLTEAQALVGGAACKLRRDGGRRGRRRRRGRDGKSSEGGGACRILRIIGNSIQNVAIICMLDRLRLREAAVSSAELDYGFQ